VVHQAVPIGLTAPKEERPPGRAALVGSVTLRDHLLTALLGGFSVVRSRDYKADRQ